MENQLAILSFYTIGILVFLPPLVVTWVANEDILAGTTLPSPVVAIAGSVDIIAKMITISIVNTISLPVLMILHSLLSAVGLVLLVVLNVDLRIIGVLLLGYAYGFEVVLYLRQSTNFKEPDKLSGAFLSGSNIATLIASAGYTGLTTWTCVSPRIVLACCIPVSFITLAFYPFLAANKSSSKQEIDTSKYRTIPQTPTSSRIQDKSSRTIARKVYFLFKVFPFASYFFLANFCLSISLTSILTTVTFPSSPFQPRDHYQYYRLVSDIGIALGGTEVVLVSCLSPKHVESLRIKRVWILVLLHTLLAAIFVFTSWFRFVPNVYALLVMVFVQGILYGLISVHNMTLVSNIFNNPMEKGAAMGYVEVAFSVGRLAAGLVGMFVEVTLRQHCTNALLLGHYCLARIPTANGWETNVHC